MTASPKLYAQRLERLRIFINLGAPAPIMEAACVLLLRTRYRSKPHMLWGLAMRFFADWRESVAVSLKVRWWRLSGKDPLAELDRECDEAMEKAARL